MSDTLILGIVTSIGGIITAVGVVLIGYWQFAAKKQTAKTAAIAETAAKAAVTAAAAVTETASTVKMTMDTTVATIEKTATTVQQTAAKVAEVQKQTDGHLSAMEALLQQKTNELAEQAATLRTETEKVARLTGALHEARGSLPQRRDEEQP